MVDASEIEASFVEASVVEASVFVAFAGTDNPISFANLIRNS